MVSLAFKRWLSESTSTELSNSLSLAPSGFFEKKLNITRGALSRYFSFWNEAILSFINDNYVAHDALVGENACHIRAYVLMNLAIKKEKNYLFYATLVTITTELKRIIDDIKSLPIDNHDVNNSVQDFLLKNDLLFNFPTEFADDIKYIIDSFLLTLTKQSFPVTGLTLNEKTSNQPVRDWEFAYNRAQYLVHNTQKELSASSCAYIIKEASLIKDNPFSMLLDIKQDAHRRHFIPQFVTAKIIFLRMLEQNRQIVLKITRFINTMAIDQLILRLRPNKDKTDFELCPSSVEDTTCVVVAGVVAYSSIPESLDDYKTRLFSNSILALFLANFAIHPQYSGELKELPPPFDEVIEKKPILSILTEKLDFETKKQYATDKGCSLENPSLLFINHMYCDNSANYYYEQNIVSQIYSIFPSKKNDLSLNRLNN